MCKAIRDLMEDSREEGREEGKRSMIIYAIKKKLEKNKTVEQISDELEISVEEAEKYVCLIYKELKI